jgi:hypothetical protein
MQPSERQNWPPSGLYAARNAHARAHTGSQASNCQSSKPQTDLSPESMHECHACMQVVERATTVTPQHMTHGLGRGDDLTEVCGGLPGRVTGPGVASVAGNLPCDSGSRMDWPLGRCAQVAVARGIRSRVDRWLSVARAVKPTHPPAGATVAPAPMAASPQAAYPQLGSRPSPSPEA